MDNIEKKLSDIDLTLTAGVMCKLVLLLIAFFVTFRTCSFYDSVERQLDAVVEDCNNSCRSK